MIQRYTLTNGIRLVYEELPFLRSVSLGVWIGTGSRDEDPHQSGISHFLEHMFFKGTTSKTAKQLAELFDQVGGQVNAYTTKEYTSLNAKVLDEHVELAFSLLAEMIWESTFAEEEMEREKQVIVEEIKMYEDNPEEAVHDWVVERSYAGHPLGINILGSEASLLKITRTDLIAYMKKGYTPDNMVIAVAGRIDGEKILALVESMFGQARGKRDELKQSLPAFTPVKVFDPRPIEQAHVCLAVPGFSYTDARMYALALINHSLGASSSSLLFQEVRENRGLAYNVFSYHTPFRDSGLFTIYYGCSPDRADEVYQLTEEMIRHLRVRGIDVTDLNKAKMQMISSFWLNHENTSSRIGRMAKNELYFGRQLELDEAVAALQSVTPADVKFVLEELFRSPLAVVALGPYGTNIEGGMQGENTDG